MGLHHAQSGFNSVNEYQISGLPWVTSSVGGGSVQRWDFHRVTKEVSVSVAVSGTLRVGFTAAGVAADNYFLVGEGRSQTFNVRTASLFVRADEGAPEYSVFASLTLVKSGDFPALSGSVAWEGV